VRGAPHWLAIWPLATPRCSGRAIARSSSDAPEIDGVVHILDGKGLKVGDWAQVRITKSGAYDLEGRIAK